MVRPALAHYFRIFRLRTVAPCAVLLGGLALLGGCERSAAEARPQAAKPVDEDALRKELDEVIDFTFKRRHLSTDQNAAWQVLHGIVAFKQDFEIRHEGKLVPAVDYLLGGGQLRGWQLEAGPVNPATGRRGLRAVVDPGSKTGQGHYDQWLGYMSGCDLPPETPIVYAGETYTLADLLAQTELDSYRNADREFSWTLMGLTLYHPSDYTWTAGDGSTWSIPKLVEIEAGHDLNTSACGGTHRLVGLTLALNRHIAQGGKIEGPWAAAQQKIQQAIETAKKYQNPNGSFSSNYFIRPGSTPDVTSELSTTGHTLEFLMLALDDEQIREPWITRAVARLCRIYRMTQNVALECGGLYHATSGLILYRERRFGESGKL